MPLLAVSFALLLAAQIANPVSQPNVPSGQRVLVAAVRTSGHFSLSSSEKFEEAANAVEQFLAAQRVVMAEDPVRKKVRLEGAIPRGTLLNIADDAGASHLLELTIDRPVTAWIDITARCADAMGNVLWEERGNYINAFSSAGHVEKAVSKLTEKLMARLGGPCLPLPSAASPLKPASTRLLREGTLVTLKFAHAVTSRTAHAGDIVEFAVADDVRADNLTVIRKGARAFGSISAVQGASGREGALQLTLEGIRCHGRTINIRGVETAMEERKVAGLTIPFGLSGFLLPGGQDMAEGSEVHAVIAADVELPVLEAAAEARR